MYIHEVCKLTGLTKKAIEYYQLKGLVSPMLRQLELTTDEIKQVLESPDRKIALSKIKQTKELHAKARLTRLELMEQLIHDGDIASINEQLELLNQQTTIREKLMAAFPGFFGRYLSFHFGPFLNEPIKTEEQSILYETVLDYLDQLEPFTIPEELQSMLDEADLSISAEQIEGMISEIQGAYNDMESFREKHKDAMTRYAEFKKTREYNESVMARLMEWYRGFGETSGYNDVFIPALRKLSPAYDEYYRKMLES